MTQPELWFLLRQHLEKWFHQPDLEGLRIALAAACSHHYSQNRPVWLMCLGEPSSGKGEILMHSLKSIPATQYIGSLTPKCFLSSWQKGGNRNSLLHRSGSSKIWLAKDFTTFASMRVDDRGIVAAKLREIWDGNFTSDTGVGETQHWEGKITLIAAATPSVEEKWGAMRNLGERFLTLRWRSGDWDGVKAKARAQAGHEKEIRAETTKLATLLTEMRDWPSTELPTDFEMRKVDEMADIVAILRVHIPRESDGKREILSVPAPEVPSRIINALTQIARTHAGMMGQSHVIEEDVGLCGRVALDSIPEHRRQVLENLPLGDGIVDFGDLLRLTGLPRTSLQRIIEDLVALGVMDSNLGASEDWSGKIAALTPEFKARLTRSGLAWQNAKRSIHPVVQFPNPK